MFPIDRIIPPIPKIHKESPPSPLPSPKPRKHLYSAMPQKTPRYTDNHSSVDAPPNNPISIVAQIAQRYIQNDTDQPTTPFRTPQEIHSILDLSINHQGLSSTKTMELLEQLTQMTPRSTSNRFYNQLFAGRDLVATAADMLVPVLNTSMYTYKAAGPMAIVEETVLKHMAKKIGFKQPGPQGIFTPGGSISNLMAMLIGRNQAAPNLRNEGTAPHQLTCYASQDAHYSIIKNAGILGIGRNNVRKIKTDSQGRMNTNDLQNTIRNDLQSGCTPCIIVATAGTTVLGSFDPIDPCNQIAKEFGIWLHVDASFGGSALMSPSHRHLLNGIEAADSVAWNPHKVMGVPLSGAALITREPGALGNCLDETADYLFQCDDDAYNSGTRSIQCGRRNDALKVWAAWNHHGDIGYQKRINHLMNLANHCAQFVKAHEQMHLTQNPEFVNVCFEVQGKSSRDICDTLREQNELLVGHAVVNGQRIIRVPFVNGNLTTDDVDEMLNLILKTAASLPTTSTPPNSPSLTQQAQTTP